MSKTCTYPDCERGTRTHELCLWHRPKSVPKAKKRYIKHESDKARVGRLKARDDWFVQNPANASPNTWYCYLNRLSADCPYLLTKEDILFYGLEHVVPKVKSRDLKFEVGNLQAACGPCNKVKGSQTIERLIERYDGWGGPVYG